MPSSQREILEQLVKEMTEVRMVVIGSREMGIDGLVQAQKADEEFKEKSLDTFRKIHSSLEKIEKSQQKLDGRLTTIEEPLKVLRVVLIVATRIRKKTIIVWGSILSFLTVLVKGWDWLTHLFKN